MNIRPKKLNWTIAALVVPVVYGFGGFVSQIEASTPQGADPQNAELRLRVSEALHAQPYFDDRHIDVSARGGTIILSGIVFSDWDLQDALRTARKAAGARPVIDNLSIEEGGR
jgi:osmotically-inducible protein OsmY